MKNPSVLIIDDDAIFSARLEQMLIPYAENVHCSPTAENGTYFISKERPDFIFLDNQLPRLNGNEVIELYREMSPGTRIILMSGTFDIDEVADAIVQKVDHVVEKSQMTNEKLQTIIKEVENEKREKKKKKSIGKSMLPFGKVKTKRKSIAIVDDDELFSIGLDWILNKMKKPDSKDSFARYQNASSFFTAIEVSRPDIVFLDYYLEETTAKSVIIRLRECAPDAKILIVSSQVDPKIALELAEMNVYGYIVKSDDWKTSVVDYMEELAI